MTKIYFRDANEDSATLYVGTEAHMDGLSWEGGSPYEVPADVAEAQIARGYRSMTAPEFWAVVNAPLYREMVASSSQGGEL